jgi:putative membrane protein
MKHVRPTPLGALARGLAAGAVGSAVQDLFFQATRAIAPATPRDVFSPPEPEQRDETATQTVARRLVACFMQRPLSREGKAKGGVVVHYAFGAALGGGYGLLRETVPAARTPAGVIAFGVTAWVVGDDLVLPAFRLAAGPAAYPLKTHAYAIAAHLVFSAAVAAAYEAMRPRSIAGAAAALWAMQTNLALARRLPAIVRPAVRAIIGTTARARAARPLTILRDAAAAR